MTIIGWLVLIEVIVGFGLLVWYVRKAHRHVKHSPAVLALEEHLKELEAAKQAKNSLKTEKNAKAGKK